MTEPHPYAPVPIQIAAGHPMLDATGFEDLAAQAPVHQPVALDYGTGEMHPAPTADELSAAMAVLAKANPDSVRVLLSHGLYSGPDLPPGLAELLNAPSANVPQRPDRDHRPRCHRCDHVATTQWQRRATAAEADDWHAAREQWIRQHNDGRPAAQYEADRSDTVTQAVFGCDEHDLTPLADDDSDEAQAFAERTGAELRTLVHEADCGGHGACGCGGDDA